MIKNMQHYEHRVHLAILILKTRNAQILSEYLTKNGHQITAKKIRKYLAA